MHIRYLLLSIISLLYLSNLAPSTPLDSDAALSATSYISDKYVILKDITKQALKENNRKQDVHKTEQKLDRIHKGEGISIPLCFNIDSKTHDSDALSACHSLKSYYLRSFEITRQTIKAESHLHKTLNDTKNIFKPYQDSIDKRIAAINANMKKARAG